MISCLLKGDQLTHQVAGYFPRVLVHELRRGRTMDQEDTLGMAAQDDREGLLDGGGSSQVRLPVTRRRKGGRI